MKLTRQSVHIDLQVEPELLPIPTEFCDGGTDPEWVEWAHREVDDGNYWAWCMATVTVTWKPFYQTVYCETPRDYIACAVLGGCSFASAREFMESLLYDAMIDEALNRLNQQIRRLRPQTIMADLKRGEGLWG